MNKPHQDESEEILFFKIQSWILTPLLAIVFLPSINPHNSARTRKRGRTEHLRGARPGPGKIEGTIFGVVLSKVETGGRSVEVECQHRNRRMTNSARRVQNIGAVGGQVRARWKGGRFWPHFRRQFHRFSYSSCNWDSCNTHTLSFSFSLSLSFRRKAYPRGTCSIAITCRQYRGEE